MAGGIAGPQPRRRPPARSGGRTRRSREGHRHDTRDAPADSLPAAESHPPAGIGRCCAPSRRFLVRLGRSESAGSPDGSHPAPGSRSCRYRCRRCRPESRRLRSVVRSAGMQSRRFRRGWKETGRGCSRARRGPRRCWARLTRLRAECRIRRQDTQRPAASRPRRPAVASRMNGEGCGPGVRGNVGSSGFMDGCPQPVCFRIDNRFCPWLRS